jgi:predicted acylesterase/phospholipase RssA
VSSLTERHRLIAPFDAMEARLVRLSMERPGSVHPRDEAALRYALALARLVQLRLPDGRDVAVADVLEEFRDRLRLLLADAFVRNKVDAALLARAVEPATQATRAARARLVVRLGDRASPDLLETELTQRSLVLACGGGGGSGYANLGAFALLESAGLRPALIAGASMGSILGLFRARASRFDVSQVPKIMGELETRRVFRPFNTENRFSLPSAIRLELRTGIGPYFEYDGVPLRLRDLPIPLLVSVAGLRRGALPRPLAYYERFTKTLGGLDLRDSATLRGAMQSVLGVVTELARTPNLLKSVVLGGTDETREFDVVDAVGYSSAVPGALHYDLARDAPLEVERLEALFAEHDVFRLTDGGVVDNVPARTAWRAVQRGVIGTRNAFVLALDGFSPRLSTPLWLPIQRLAADNVRRSKPYAHHYFAFKRTMSPIDLLPRAAAVMRHVESAKRELIEDLPFLQRMLEPLPGLPALHAA